MDELFLAACEENGISFCSKYIRKQFDVNVSDSAGCNGIMKAALRGNYELVKLLFDAGANIYSKDRYNQTVLHYAVQSNHEKLVKFVLSKTVDSTAGASITQLPARSYTNRAVPKDMLTKTGSCKVGLENDPLDHSYMEASRNIKTSETHNAFHLRADPTFQEDKIYNMIIRYEDMDLSECESDPDICESGKKKEKKAKRSGKKARGGKSGGKSGKKKKGKGNKK